MYGFMAAALAAEGNVIIVRERLDVAPAAAAEAAAAAAVAAALPPRDRDREA